MNPLLLLRSLLLAPFVILWTGLCAGSAVILLFFKGPKWLAVKISDLWAGALLLVTGVRLEVKGAEHLPKGGYLLVLNHTSHYDIPVLLYSAPKYPHFGAKSELYSIPIFGAAMTAMGALVIERKNREKVMKIYKEAEARVARGEVFALAPEGTRQSGGGELGPFKSGPFFFAVNSKMPVVPVVIAHCEEVLPKHGLIINSKKWIQTVNVEFLEPISPEPYSEKNMSELKELVHDRMSVALKKYY